MLLVLRNSHKFFFEDLYCSVPLFAEIDYCKSIKQVKSSECKVFNSTLLSKKNYLLDSFRVLFKKTEIKGEFVDIFSLYNIKKQIHDRVSVLLDKIMHQSCVLLNSNVIENTTTVLELDLGRDRVYWVIQLGALRNLKKVFEIVDKLKMNNYLVYTSPCDPKPGELIRIFVCPSYSKENLEYLLDDLCSLTGLFGKVKSLPISTSKMDICLHNN